MKKFNFDSFVQAQFEEFKDAFTLEEVKDILFLGDDVCKYSQLSVFA